MFFFLLLPLIAREQVEKTQILFEVQVYYPSSSRDLPWEVEELYAYMYVIVVVVKKNLSFDDEL